MMSCILSVCSISLMALAGFRSVATMVVARHTMMPVALGGRRGGRRISR